MSERGKRFVNPREKFVIHEDMLGFFRDYDPKHTFQEQVGNKRDEKLKEGEPFWNTDHDEEMKETAEQRSKHPLFRFPKVVRRR